jgi:hypothetical protein
MEWLRLAQVQVLYRLRPLESREALSSLRQAFRTSSKYWIFRKELPTRGMFYGGLYMARSGRSEHGGRAGEASETVGRALLETRP